MHSSRGGFNALVDDLAAELAARRPALAKALRDEALDLQWPEKVRATPDGQYIKSYLAQHSHPSPPAKPALILQRAAPTKQETMAKALSVAGSVMDRAMAQHAAGQITGVEVSMLESASNRMLETVRSRLG